LRAWPPAAKHFMCLAVRCSAELGNLDSTPIFSPSDSTQHCPDHMALRMVPVLALLLRSGMGSCRRDPGKANSSSSATLWDRSQTRKVRPVARPGDLDPFSHAVYL